MKELHKRVSGAIAEADKDLLDGLHSVGFKTNMGEDESGCESKIFRSFSCFDRYWLRSLFYT